MDIEGRTYTYDELVRIVLRDKKEQERNRAKRLRSYYKSVHVPVTIPVHVPVTIPVHVPVTIPVHVPVTIPVHVPVTKGKRFVIPSMTLWPSYERKAIKLLEEIHKEM